MQPRIMIWIFAVVVSALLSSNVWAQRAAIGQRAPDFALTDSEGQHHRLADFKGKIVVLHFQSAACPWDTAYQPILNHLAQKFQKLSVKNKDIKQIQFLAINANHSERVDQIKRYVSQAAIPYPVLMDPRNQIADAYGATTTPHIFVIDSDDQQTLAYKGGIEKAPLSPPNCGKSQQQFLEPVLWALLDGATPPFTETVNIGCSIKRIN